MIRQLTRKGYWKRFWRSGVKIEGAEVVIVGRSNIVGKPLANMLIQKSATGNATVTVCHTRTKNLTEHTGKADILIAAAGRPNTITADMVKQGVVVIDVGVNRVEDSSRERGYRLVGDVDFEEVKKNIQENVKNNPKWTEDRRRFGTGSDMPVMSELGILPTLNWQTGQCEKLQGITLTEIEDI